MVVAGLLRYTVAVVAMRSYGDPLIVTDPSSDGMPFPKIFDLHATVLIR
jgi:hypothetical protein